MNNRFSVLHLFCEVAQALTLPMEDIPMSIRLPVTLLPILLFAVIVAMFIFYVPAGGDLISRRGDIWLGCLLGGIFSVCVSRDLRRFRELAAVRKGLDALANKSGDEKK